MSAIFGAQQGKPRIKATLALFESIVAVYESVGDTVSELAGYISEIDDAVLRAVLVDLAGKELQVIVEAELAPIIRGTRLETGKDKDDSEYRKLVGQMTTTASVSMRSEVDVGCKRQAAPAPATPATAAAPAPAADAKGG